MPMGANFGFQVRDIAVHGKNINPCNRIFKFYHSKKKNQKENAVALQYAEKFIKKRTKRNILNYT